MLSRNQVSIKELHGKIHPHYRTTLAKLSQSTTCVAIKGGYDNSIIISKSTARHMKIYNIVNHSIMCVFELNSKFKEVHVVTHSTYLTEYKERYHVLYYAFCSLEEWQDTKAKQMFSFSKEKR